MFTHLLVKRSQKFWSTLFMLFYSWDAEGKCCWWFQSWKNLGINCDRRYCKGYGFQRCQLRHQLWFSWFCISIYSQDRYASISSALCYWQLLCIVVVYLESIYLIPLFPYLLLSCSQLLSSYGGTNCNSRRHWLVLKRRGDPFYLFDFSLVGVWNRTIGQGRKERRSHYLLHWRWHSISAKHSKCHDSFRLRGTFLDYGLAQKEVEEAQADKRINFHWTKRWERMRNLWSFIFSYKAHWFLVFFIYFFGQRPPPFFSKNFEAVMRRSWVHVMHYLRRIAAVYTVEFLAFLNWE